MLGFSISSALKISGPTKAEKSFFRYLVGPKYFLFLVTQELQPIEAHQVNCYQDHVSAVYGQKLMWFDVIFPPHGLLSLVENLDKHGASGQ